MKESEIRVERCVKHQENGGQENGGQMSVSEMSVSGGTGENAHLTPVSNVDQRGAGFPSGTGRYVRR